MVVWPDLTDRNPNPACVAHSEARGNVVANVFHFFVWSEVLKDFMKGRINQADASVNHTDGYTICTIQEYKALQLKRDQQFHMMTCYVLHNSGYLSYILAFLRIPDITNASNSFTRHSERRG